MTILYLTNNPQLAGTARILRSWVAFGRDAGDRVAVVVPGPGALFTRLSADGIPVLASPMPWPDRRRPLPSLRELWRVWRWARRHGVDLVHCNEHDVYPFGQRLARLLGVPVVCHVRFQVSREFCAWAFGGRRQPGALCWTSQQQRADCADAIAGIVPDDKQHLIRLGPDLSIFTAASPRRTALRAEFGVRPDEVAIGAATALRPVKRIDDFLDLVIDAAARHPHVVGLLAGGAVAGDEAYADSIRARIAASGLGRRLRWVGHLDEIEPFLRVLDVFVSTSEYETFGNSVCEAMACQLPVAGYVGGSIHEVIGDAGAVVPNGDLAALTRAIEPLIASADARAEWGARGRARVESTFNPVVSFERLRTIHRNLVRAT